MPASSNRMFDRNRFLLGVFAANCASGLTITKVPERWDNSWENNRQLALMLDEAGIDFMLPIARWIGYGGETNFHAGVLDPMTWAAGLLAVTKHINVFATIHTVCNHPVVVAKAYATAHQIGGGRVGLNVVAGWNRPEYEAMGLNLPDDHETRYGYAQEWFDLLKALWTRDRSFDWEGEFFRLRNVLSDPRPTTPVPILNAAGSRQGREFAARNADYLFTPAIDLRRSRDEIAGLKQQAVDLHRSVDVLTLSHVICRPTEKEAQAYLEYTGKTNADWAAVDNLVRLLFADSHAFPRDLLDLIRDRMAAGHGGYPLVGTPTQVADGLCALHESGFRGTTLSFVDYRREFPYFRDNVLPILVERGLRPSAP